MSKLILKLFIKDYENTKSPKIREKYGLLSSAVGIFLNIVLSFSKLIIGSLSSSVSITADALNNLSDAGSCIVTLVGFKMAAMKPDKEHPFGHGRIEYVAALIVGFIVELMGFELIKSSVEKIKNPQEVIFSIPAVIVLLISILGKLWLALFNRFLGKKISSPALTAVMTDSISDICATTFTLFALILSRYTSLPLDGIFGIVVSLFIMYSGYGILKETIGIILGVPPSKELVDQIVKLIKEHDSVIDIHDLVIHSYGENRLFGSVHVEVPADCDILVAHDNMDHIEREVLQKFGINLVVHMDPLVVNDERVQYLRNLTFETVKKFDSRLSIHDFRVVEGPKQTNLIFDLVIPFDYETSQQELKNTIRSLMKEHDPRYSVVTTVEYSYT